MKTLTGGSDNLNYYGETIVKLIVFIVRVFLDATRLCTPEIQGRRPQNGNV